MVSLPRLAFDLMAKGDWATAIEVATTVGPRDVNTLTNLVFWFRHPMLVGQLRIRDETDGDPLVRVVLVRPTTG